MALPAFATVDDLSDRLGRDLTTTEAVQAQAALEDASALIRSYIGKTWVTDEGALDPDAPDVLLTVTVAVARRVLEGPGAGVRSTSLGDAAITYDTSSTGLFLTGFDKSLLASTFGGFGLTSVRVEAPRLAAGRPVNADWWEDTEDEEIA